jgi:hypothetical protein
LNPRPPEPHSGALPDCATSRRQHAPHTSAHRSAKPSTPPNPEQRAIPSRSRERRSITVADSLPPSPRRSSYELRETHVMITYARLIPAVTAALTLSLAAPSHAQQAPRQGDRRRTRHDDRERDPDKVRHARGEGSGAAVQPRPLRLAQPGSAALREFQKIALGPRRAAHGDVPPAGSNAWRSSGSRTRRSWSPAISTSSWVGSRGDSRSGDLRYNHLPMPIHPPPPRHEQP